MKHYIYRTTHTNGKYYIGRHSTDDINDGYCGSGKWVKSIKNKSELIVDIIEYAETFEQLKILEKQYLIEVIGKTNNMNFNNNSCGFATGDLNWSRSDIGRQTKSLRKKGRTLESQYGIEKALHIREKLSNARTGHKTNKPSWNAGFTKDTSQSVKQISDNNKGRTPWNKGIQTGIKSFTGEKHTENSIELMCQSQQFNRINNRITCEHCSKNLDKANYHRHHGDKCKFKP
jgi:hypothetical protein